MPGRKALGEGVWGRGDAPSLGRHTGAVDFGSWFWPCRAHVGLLGASWGALGHFACVFERVWVSLAPFGRFGVGFLVYFRSNFHFLCDFSFIRRFFFAFEAIANTL